MASASSVIVETQDRSISAATRTLWLVDVDYRYGLEHGMHLRVFNHTRELVARGHEVYFAVLRKKADDGAEKTKYLEKLKSDGFISDYLEVEYRHPKLRGKVAFLALHPALSNKILRRERRPIIDRVRAYIAEKRIDACLFVDRSLLFVMPEIKNNTQVITDWIDSYVMYRVRELNHLFKTFQIAHIPSSLRALVSAFAEESYYGKVSAVNLVVSPIDRKYLDAINRVPHKNSVLLNGVHKRENVKAVPKVKGRLIFTGNMDFPPNYDSAIWFIDQVLPLLRERREGVKFVVAGANPVGALRARAGDDVEVTGFVHDMGAEIAKSELYVAPLISGGGFKNKVVEAITSGTFVVGTGVALEFLDPDLREYLVIADTPGEMVEAIFEFLDNPEKYDGRVEALKKIIDQDFAWENRTKELLAFVRA